MPSPAMQTAAQQAIGYGKKARTGTQPKSRSSKRLRRMRRRIYERDEWMCWLCGTKVDRWAKATSRDSPSLDHVIPQSEGGKWTMENLKTAHRGCNNERQTPPRRPLDTPSSGRLAA